MNLLEKFDFPMVSSISGGRRWGVRYWNCWKMLENVFFPANKVIKPLILLGFLCVLGLLERLASENAGSDFNA